MKWHPALFVLGALATQVKSLVAHISRREGKANKALYRCLLEAIPSTVTLMKAPCLDHPLKNNMTISTVSVATQLQKVESETVLAVLTTWASTSVLM